MKALALLFLIFTSWAGCTSSPTSTHENHDEAVLEFSEAKGFRLSNPALLALGIETQVLQKVEPSAIPVSALVYYQAEIGVYRLRDGWFQLIPLDEPDQLRPGDAVAVRGAAFLRVTDLSLFGEGLSSHHH